VADILRESPDEHVDLVVSSLIASIFSLRPDTGFPDQLGPFFESARIIAPNCSGVLPTAVAPIAASFFDTPASCST